jgi:hypothetical protein
MSKLKHVLAFFELTYLSVSVVNAKIKAEYGMTKFRIIDNTTQVMSEINIPSIGISKVF